ncbi:hypothetical protein STANM309S_05191 [Streptomyces tanashiensis]
MHGAPQTPADEHIAEERSRRVEEDVVDVEGTSCDQRALHQLDEQHGRRGGERDPEESARLEGQQRQQDPEGDAEGDVSPSCLTVSTKPGWLR